MLARRPGAAALVAAGLLAAAPARAEPSADPRCHGAHSLFDPLPDACLGVIDTDRPHQTDTPHVVAAGHAQFESALAQVQLGGNVDGSGERSARVVLFDDNYKLGVVSGVDVQLMFTHAAYVPAQRQLEPPGPLGVRLKVSVVEERGWVPAITLVPWVFLPVAPGESLRAGPYVFWGWELPAHLELEVNAGLLFGASPKPLVAPVLASALTCTVVGELRVFIDAYTTGPDAALGTGALWALSRDAQVDLGTYVGLHGAEPAATPFLGLSVRR